MNIESSPTENRKVLKYDDALLYCALLDIDGKKDWRMPTIEELQYLYNLNRDFRLSWYWHSEKNSNDKLFVIPIRTI